MTPESLIRSPGFQLNLLLWMAKEQPEEAALVYPLFSKLGFRLLTVEQPFPLPEETVRAVRDCGLDIAAEPEPELILQRTRDGKALYFEAKAASFGPESSTSRQARGHLLACGPAFAEVQRPLRECLLCYVVPQEDASQMQQCLAALRRQLEDAKLEPGTASTHGLGVANGDCLQYVWDEAFARFADSAAPNADERRVVVLRGVTADTDPSPLVLLYSDEDYPNPALSDLFRLAFLRQVHARLVSDLHQSPTVGTQVVVLSEHLLEKTTQGVYSYLGRNRQRALRRLVNARVFHRMREYWQDRAPGLVERKRNGIALLFPDPDVKAAFLDWLEHEEFGAGPVPPPEDPLFVAMGLGEIE